MTVRRGDIFYADLSPVVGSEQGGIRPVLIVQQIQSYRDRRCDHEPPVQSKSADAYSCRRYAEWTGAGLDHSARTGTYTGQTAPERKNGRFGRGGYGARRQSVVRQSRHTGDGIFLCSRMKKDSSRFSVQSQKRRPPKRCFDGRFLCGFILSVCALRSVHFQISFPLPEPISKWYCTMPRSIFV